MSTVNVNPKQADLARSLGIDPALITRYKARGMPVDSLEAAQQWMADNVRSRVRTIGQADKPAAVEPDTLPLLAADEAPPPLRDSQQAESLSYSVDRARRERYEADMAEIKLREQQGDLVRKADVRITMAERLGEVRTNLLQIPARLAPLVAPETDQGKVHAMIDAELRTVLLKLTA